MEGHPHKQNHDCGMAGGEGKRRNEDKGKKGETRRKARKRKVDASLVRLSLHPPLWYPSNGCGRSCHARCGGSQGGVGHRVTFPHGSGTGEGGNRRIYNNNNNVVYIVVMSSKQTVQTRRT